VFISDAVIAEARNLGLAAEAKQVKSDVRNNRQALMAALRNLPSSELEGTHLTAVDLLLAYLNDREIYDAFHGLSEWHP